MDLSHLLKLTEYHTKEKCFIDVDDIKHVVPIRNIKNQNEEVYTVITFHEDGRVWVVESPEEIHAMMEKVDSSWLDKFMDFFGL
jgi:hypothetical protein